MKTLKKIGIIAVTALIIIGISSCEDLLGLGGDDELTGTVQIRLSSYGPYTGTTIGAIYSGDEAVSYQWYVGTAKAAGTAAQAQTFKIPDFNTGVTQQNVSVRVFPTSKKADFDSGKYEDYKPASVVIYPAPAHIDFFGVWVMQGSLNNDYKADSNAPVTDETITLTDGKFRLDSSYDGYSTAQPYLNSGYNQNAVNKFTLTAPKEFLEFDITAWAVDTAPSGNLYTKAYKLTLSNGKSKGYSAVNDTTCYLFYRTTTNTIVLAWGDSTKKLYASGGVAREFIRNP